VHVLAAAGESDYRQQSEETSSLSNARRSAV
jgi:hypothetical protein